LCVVINLTIFLRGLTEKHQSNVVRWSAIENQEEQESEITVHVICVARDSIKLQAYRKNIKTIFAHKIAWAFTIRGPTNKTRKTYAKPISG
jgi:hypothetical protein